MAERNAEYFGWYPQDRDDPARDRGAPGPHRGAPAQRAGADRPAGADARPVPGRQHPGARAAPRLRGSLHRHPGRQAALGHLPGERRGAGGPHHQPALRAAARIDLRAGRGHQLVGRARAGANSLPSPPTPSSAADRGDGVPLVLRGRPGAAPAGGNRAHPGRARGLGTALRPRGAGREHRAGGRCRLHRTTFTWTGSCRWKPPPRWATCGSGRPTNSTTTGSATRAR